MCFSMCYSIILDTFFPAFESNLESNRAQWRFSSGELFVMLFSELHILATSFGTILLGFVLDSRRSAQNQRFDLALLLLRFGLRSAA
jgi:hypothetical protein